MSVDVEPATSALLPEGFSELEQFAEWILPTEQARNRKRISAAYSDIKLFYDTMLKQKDRWLSHLDQFSKNNLPIAEQRLFYLSLSLMEVAPAVEYFQSPDLTDAVPADRLRIHLPGYREAPGNG